MKKVIVIGVIALFIGVGFQPAYAVDIPKDEEIEPKDYLFETIIEIDNNPEVKELLEECGHNIFYLNYDYDSIIKQIIFKNPRLFFSMLFTKPKMTDEYLNSAYNQGYDIVNIIGEDEALEMIKSVEISNSEIFDELNYIIMNDEDLSNRISILAELNEELKPDKPFEDNPIICGILLLLMVTFTVISLIFYELMKSEENLFIKVIFAFFWLFFDIFYEIPAILFYFIFSCVTYIT